MFVNRRQWYKQVVLEEHDQIRFVIRHNGLENVFRPPYPLFIGLAKCGPKRRCKQRGRLGASHDIQYVYHDIDMGFDALIFHLVGVPCDQLPLCCRCRDPGMHDRLPVLVVVPMCLRFVGHVCVDIRRCEIGLLHKGT